MAGGRFRFMRKAVNFSCMLTCLTVRLRMEEPAGCAAFLFIPGMDSGLVSRLARVALGCWALVLRDGLPAALLCA